MIGATRLQANAPPLTHGMRAGPVRTVYVSGGCEVDLARRELRIDGSPVPLGGRAFEIVEMLAQSAGEIVTRDELMARVWPGAIVMDNTLAVHTAAIRKALGPYRTLLKTESRRGYRLLGDWSVQRAVAAAPVLGPQRIRSPDEPAATNVPVIVTPLIGRSQVLQRIRDLVSAYRIVTLTGPGGIGKTALAKEIARGSIVEFDGGAWIVELASLSDPGLVPTAVASVLGVKLGGGNISARAVAGAVGGTALLLVLDNCEHVVEEIANFVETFASLCPRATILVTSREILRINGEHAYPVPPLEVPAADEEAPDAILGRSAVELFIARATALSSHFTLASGTLSAIGAICRHLDGIPLAIEFAAAREALLGVEQVAAGLQDRFALLTSGRRTALPRHRTLRAVLDWSHELLPETERLVLRRLAIFPAGFTLDAAVAVMRGSGLDAAAVVESIVSLVTKSLVTLGKSETGNRWHLLETTRVYANEKLVESGESRQVARLQAEFCLALFAPFGAEGQLQSAMDNLDRYRVEADNLRAGLNWAFSSDGDAALGVSLAAAAADFWVAASLIPGSCEWASKAVAHIGEAAGTRTEMLLQCSLGIMLVLTRGMIDDARNALTRALTLAHELADRDYQQRATHNLWMFSARASALDDALATARKYAEIVRGGDVQSRAVADCWLGTTLVYRGAHSEANARLHRAIGEYPVESRSRDRIRFGGDTRASAFGHVAVSLLSLGLVDAASRSAMNAVEEARSTRQPAVLCVALAWAAGFIFLSLGDLELAERHSDELIDHAVKHELRPYYVAGLCVRGSLAVRRADPAAGIDPLRRGLTEMLNASYLLFFAFFCVELAAGLAALGRIDEGLAEIDVALRFASEKGHHWFVPETLRVRAHLLALRDPDDPAVEECFHQGRRLAREQDALFWELRLAVDFARLRLRQNRRDEARQILAPVYRRFTEGFGAPDMLAAKQLLE